MDWGSIGQYYDKVKYFTLELQARLLEVSTLSTLTRVRRELMLK